MLLSAVSVLVVAQSSSEIPEGLTNNPVFKRHFCFLTLKSRLNVLWLWISRIQISLQLAIWWFYLPIFKAKSITYSRLRNPRDLVTRALPLRKLSNYALFPWNTNRFRTCPINRLCCMWCWPPVLIYVVSTQRDLGYLILLYQWMSYVMQSVTLIGICWLMSCTLFMCLEFSRFIPSSFDLTVLH